MRKKIYYLKPRSFLWKQLILAGILYWAATFTASAQKTYTYQGKVTDKTGETLPGVNVVVKASPSIGAVTDINGNFSLTTGQANEVLVFSFIGMLTQEVAANSGTPVTVILQDKTVGLNELVVIGYGVQKKSVVTGAISSVKATDLNNMQITRIEQALQGRTSGLTIASSSGQPGSSSTVRIRGTTSINKSDPLFVVDGVPVDNGGIDYLSSSDIESIEVLKDAASAAIYGTRAACGVILVTTKKGRSGGMKLEYNAYFGTQAPEHKLDLLNATEYATLQNEAAVNSGSSKPFLFLDQFPDSLGVGTDWQSAIFNKNAGIQNHEINISGGNERSNYYTSFVYYNQEGIVATDISKYKRINLRFNSDHKIKSWLRFGNNFGYSHIKSMGLGNTNSEYGGPLASAINMDPTTPLIETNPAKLTSSPYSNQPVVLDPETGFPYGISKRVVQEMSNPLAYIRTRLGNYGWSDNFVGNVFGEVEPLTGLKFKSDLGVKLAFWGSESFTPIYYLNASNSNLANNSFSREQNQGLIWNFENTASYTRVVGKHNVTGLIGTSAYVQNSKGINTTYYNIPVDNFDEASMNYSRPNADRIGGGWESTDHELASYFARIIYNYDEKYLFTGVVRRDGSSRFGGNYKFGMFPSASAGWVATNEPFFPKTKFIDFLKIRGSYGVTGSEDIRDSRYVATVMPGYNYTFGTDGYVIGYAPDAPPNPDLRWEETTQSNIGFEATLLTSFTVVFDLFSKNTTGMLLPIVMPAYSGTGNPWGNVASMTNKGFEIELGYRKQLGELSMDLKGNASYVKNEITNLGTVKYLSGANFQSSAYEISRLAVGEPIGSFYGFQTLGVFHKQSEILGYINDSTGLPIQPNAKPGDLKFADLNGDGKISVDDRTFIGDPTPTWSFGFSISLNYKGFDLNIFGQGVYGNQIFNGLRRLDIPSANYTSAALDRWNANNPFSDYPRLTLGSDPNKNFLNPSSFYLSDGSYLRIKTLQIGYTFPKSVVQHIGLQKLRLYISSNNLLTFTKYTGFDPEIGGGSYGIDRGVYPQARSFLAGINVTL